jgi:hypothetical protein
MQKKKNLINPARSMVRTSSVRTYGRGIETARAREFLFFFSPSIEASHACRPGRPAGDNDPIKKLLLRNIYCLYVRVRETSRFCHFPAGEAAASVAASVRHHEGKLGTGVATGERRELGGVVWAAGRGLAFKGGGRHRRTLMVGVEGRASPCAEAAWPSGSVRRLGNPRRNEDDDLTRRVVIKKADRRLHSLTGGAGTSGLGCRVLLPAPHLCHLRRGSGSDIYFNVSYLVTLPGTPHDDKA